MWFSQPLVSVTIIMFGTIPIEAVFRAPLTPLEGYNDHQKAVFREKIAAGVPLLETTPSEYVTVQRVQKMCSKRALMEELKRNGVSYDLYRRGDFGGVDIDAFCQERDLPLPAPIIHESDFDCFQLDLLRGISAFREPVLAPGTACPQYYAFGDRERGLLSRYLEKVYKREIEEEEEQGVEKVDVRLAYAKVFSRTAEQYWGSTGVEGKER